MLGVVLALAAGSATAPQDPLPGVEGVRPLLERHCFECHGNGDLEADLDLKAMPWAKDPLSLVTTLRNVRDRVQRGEMPPEEKPRPEAEEIDALVGWARIVIAEHRRRHPPDPGRVPIRRLSRAEYRNTVRDLFGVAVDVTASFPADDLGFGFDNAGGVWRLSPLHLEKYLAAAEQVGNLVIDLSDPERPAVRHVEAELLEPAREGVRARGEDAAFFSSGEIAQRITLPRDGEYLLRVRAYAQQAGPEKARLVLLVDGKEAFASEVGAEPGVLERKTKLGGGRRRVAIRFPNDYYRPEDQDPTQRDRNLFVDWFEVVGPLDRYVPPAQARWFFAADPGSGEAAERARPVVLALLERAWRRPAGDDEVAVVARLVGEAVTGGETFAAALRVAIQAALASPNFLFRPETGDGSELSAPQLAARLSYFLWSSTPDDELAAAARAGGIFPLRAQALRMLADPKSRALAENFAGQWFELRSLGDVTPDRRRFPEWDAALRRDLVRESEAFFDAVLREGLPAHALFDADFTFLNARLAKHYGIAGIEGDELRRVALADRRRGGVLLHGSVLALTSNATRTSPVKRGKWILDHVLDAPPPPPTPGNDSFKDEKAVTDARTLRQQMERHRADRNCAVCHDRIDPLGFLLENYDPIGRWREQDGGGAIDATGVLPGGRKLDGPVALKDWLRGEPAVVRGVLKKLFVYAIGREPLADDLLALDELEGALGHDVALRDLVLGIVQLDAFRRRRPGG
jgi:hypothetical protein